jgi:hypothetical protein
MELSEVVKDAYEKQQTPELCHSHSHATFVFTAACLVNLILSN